jgi:hypothetical protein
MKKTNKKNKEDKEVLELIHMYAETWTALAEYDNQAKKDNSSDTELKVIRKTKIE